MSYKKIKLTQGKYALVDVEDFEFLNKRKWHLKKNENVFYAVHRRTRMRMHRLILKASADQYVDHINGNGLDNRRANIRTCSKEQNGANRKKNKNNSCGYKGVWIYKNVKRDPYAASIMWRGTKYLLGRFRTAKEAHKAYIKKAKELHGEFARWR